MKQSETKPAGTRHMVGKGRGRKTVGKHIMGRGKVTPRAKGAMGKHTRTGDGEER